MKYLALIILLNFNIYAEDKIGKCFALSADLDYGEFFFHKDEKFIYSVAFALSEHSEYAFAFNEREGAEGFKISIPCPRLKVLSITPWTEMKKRNLLEIYEAARKKLDR